jgi:hypothetical protein
VRRRFGDMLGRHLHLGLFNAIGFASHLSQVIVQERETMKCKKMGSSGVLMKKSGFLRGMCFSEG